MRFSKRDQRYMRGQNTIESQVLRNPYKPQTFGDKLYRVGVALVLLYVLVRLNFWYVL